VLEDALRVCPTSIKNAYVESATNFHDTVNMVHMAMFLEYKAEDDLTMMIACCKIIVSMGAKWRYGEYANPFCEVRKGSIDKAIFDAMGRYWYCNSVALYACQALSVVVILNREYFTNTTTGIQMLVNAMQSVDACDAMRVHCDAATVFMHLMCKANTQQIDLKCQNAIGRTGVIALALCDLNKLYQDHRFSPEPLASMQKLVNLLGMLAYKSVENQERILFTNSPGLLFGIIKMCQRKIDPQLETNTLRLLCLLQASESDRRINASRIYTMPLSDKKIVDTADINLIDAVLIYIHKRHAHAKVVTNGLQMLSRCTDDFVHPDRDPSRNEFAMVVLRQIMLPESGVCADADAQHCMLLLEKLSEHPYFARNEDLQAVVADRVGMQVEHNAARASMCSRIRANIAKFS
jgi:hypothetical protein